tara:strand:- start:113 stop:442 length:330 start_codon:yes stop_codon:yes gene_type:complete
MQVIIVLTDYKNLNGELCCSYSCFEKPQESQGETLDPKSLIDSPSVQIASLLSSFLQTVERNNRLLMQVPINESRQSKYAKSDFRYHIKKYDNVIEVDLKNWRPKGKKH